MKILIADIPDEGLDVDIKERVNIDDTSLSYPVISRLSLNKIDREIIISGSLKAEMQLKCSRCLKDFEQCLEVPVNVVYHPVEEVGPERHALKDDELDMGFYRGEELDLQELLKEQILLNAQMKPLCDEQCKGICPKCGQDLNTGQCNCSQKEVDPRLEVLKSLLEK
ncbi:conserved hypothetical protein [Candidatus Sulfobium mesophilum]|jgi:uncharacterized protein|uniref:DUF177 domain-containing protein n=1 Tax=Candidatus Sulfobium mesophilum TaxID=2016548 RepID=A0A2U3QKB7_9BACT|nr:conserved hypothetical protein [Candidatus Sulfobium mesophilum]